ncbi:MULTISPECIES: site-specific integrase [Burkholderia]|uniref:Core-binding (CB) domain-containing protein n=1 Tax=Burkholderia mayonis TaxID=1385591 RepID=A0A1B4FK82_9BURK|nr:MULTISPECIES: site-specific integrase [Burkholderia]AOJ04062.1 hypothetical protein WS70_19440 [Burkholderia mayonis]KVE45562.1 hypothetical protein WS69_03810 [Burkholderia sp. BDU5]KVE46081.1 hypothetical protein WS70_02770 [Burkholderia mayonis]
MVDKVGGTPGQMTNHLTRRGARYYFRRKIPASLHAHYGKKEIVHALGTSDYHEAKRLAAVHTVRTDAEWAILVAKHTRTDAWLADSILHSDEGEQEYRANKAHHDAASKGQREARESVDRILAGSNLPSAAQLAYLEATGGYAFDDRPTPEQAANAPSKSKAASSARTVKPFGGPTGRDNANAAVSLSAAPSWSPDSLSLAQLCEKWASERKPTARTKDKYELAVSRFYDLVGRFPADQITRRHIVEFKDKLRESGVSIPTTNHTLDCLGTLFNFGRDNELVRDNVARGVRLMDNRPNKSKRLPYTLDHLRTIFSKLPDRNADREGFWLPVLGLYTGARLGELCQLTPTDVREETYFDMDGNESRAWCIYITNEGEGKRVKTASSVRRIPVHPVLIDQGFIELAQSRSSSPRIFNLGPNKDGEFGQDWSKAYGRFLRGTCGITDPKRVFHSYRHTFKEICRDCDIGKELADAMQGHDDGDSSDDYGGEFYPL